MKNPVAAGMLYALCACVAGCAAPGATSVATTGSAAERAGVSARDATHAIAVGRSTKADVIGVLGKTQVIVFDSGFEVWVYQYKDDAAASTGPAQRVARAGARNEPQGKAEFVVLFAPSGVVAKTRIRPAPPPRDSSGK